jgi:hypothetical protein
VERDACQDYFEIIVECSCCTAEDGRRVFCGKAGGKQCECVSPSEKESEREESRDNTSN